MSLSELLEHLSLLNPSLDFNQNENIETEFPDLTSTSTLDNGVELTSTLPESNLNEIKSEIINNNKRLKFTFVGKASSDTCMLNDIQTKKDLIRKILLIDENLSASTSFFNYLDKHSITNFVLKKDYYEWEDSFFKIIQNLITFGLEHKSLERFVDLLTTFEIGTKDGIPLMTSIDMATRSNIKYSDSLKMREFPKCFSNLNDLPSFDIFVNFKASEMLENAFQVVGSELKSRVITVFGKHGNGFRESIDLIDYFRTLLNNLLIYYPIDSKDKITKILINRKQDGIVIGYCSKLNAYYVSHPFISMLFTVWERSYEDKKIISPLFDAELLKDDDLVFKIMLTKDIVRELNSAALKYLHIPEEFLKFDIGYGDVRLSEATIVPYSISQTKRRGVCIIYDPIIAALPYTRVSYGAFTHDDVSLNEMFNETVKNTEIIDSLILSWVMNPKIPVINNTSKLIIKSNTNAPSAMCSCSKIAYEQLSHFAADKNQPIGLLSRYTINGIHFNVYQDGMVYKTALYYKVKPGFPRIILSMSSGCNARLNFVISIYEYSKKMLKLEIQPAKFRVLVLQGLSSIAVDNMSVPYTTITLLDDITGENNINANDRKVIKEFFLNKGFFFKDVTEMKWFNNSYKFKCERTELIRNLFIFMQYLNASSKLDLQILENCSMYGLYNRFRSSIITKSTKEYHSSLSEVAISSSTRFDPLSMFPQEINVSFKKCREAIRTGKSYYENKPCHFGVLFTFEEYLTTNELKSRNSGQYIYGFAKRLLPYACEYLLHRKPIHSFTRDEFCFVCKSRFEYNLHTGTCKATHGTNSDRRQISIKK